VKGSGFISILSLKIFVFCILMQLLLTGCIGVSKSVTDKKTSAAAAVPSTLKILDDLDAQQEIMLIFAKAYPEKISAVEFINGGWAMQVNGKRFYFANGRFLPEELREQWNNYLPYDFYAYPWIGTEKERRAEFENPVYSVGSPFLFDALYLSPTEDISWDFQEKYSFLGVKMLINSHIKPLLDKITDRIRTAAITDPSINEWIAELQTSPPTSGWNWRVIASTNRRSNHSYGTAMDLLPRDLKGRLAYWRWKANETVDRNVYYMPPEEVIKIFEAYGFIWGGRWGLVDTMHFEYRPEILLLNGFTVER